MLKNQVLIFLFSALSLTFTSTSSLAVENDIIQVLNNSQQKILSALIPAGPEQTAQIEIIKKSLSRLATPKNLELKIVLGDTQAQAMMGRYLVISADLADWSEAERLFVIAHELGHIEKDHWAKFCAVYKKYIPGEVTPETTGPVQADLSREASQLSIQHEFDADAGAFYALKKLGFSLTDYQAVFMGPLGFKGDATHPSGPRRRMQLLELSNSN